MALCVHKFIGELYDYDEVKEEEYLCQMQVG